MLVGDVAMFRRVLAKGYGEWREGSVHNIRRSGEDTIITILRKNGTYLKLIDDGADFTWRKINRATLYEVDA